MNTLIASTDELKAQQKKLSARAIDLKLQLHDLSEELPINWEQIPAVAQRTFEAFRELAALKARIAKAGIS
jgi:hypothetical protein